MTFQELLTNSFTFFLNLSITGSYIIIAVLLARLLLKKAPKRISYILWFAPLCRLISPFSLRSRISLFNLGIFNREFYSASSQQYIPFDYATNYTPQISTGMTDAQNIIPDSFGSFATSPENSVNTLQVVLFVLSVIWLIGISAMLVYAIASFIKTKRTVRTAIKIKDNVFCSENINSPFVMGVFKPKIYLPSAISEKEREYIILHEKSHIKNLDHISKIFAFAVLTLHWFNPLCHLCYVLMNRDMEMSCDEDVLKQNDSIKKEYSSSLLSFATQRRLSSPSPLCFGESGIKQRIKNILSWKKSKALLVIVALLASSFIFVSCVSNPSDSTRLIEKNNPELNKAVSQMVLERCNEKRPYFCLTEGHKIFGYSETENETTVYGYMSYSSMHFMNGYLSDYVGSGGSDPFVATFTRENGGYKLKALETPQMGEKYSDSIREMFPEKYVSKALNDSKYYDELRSQKQAYAESALKNEGLNCPIVWASETNLTVDDYEVYSTFSGKVANFEYYPDIFIGVRMYKDSDGKYVVYEKRKDTESGKYYLASYINSSTQAVADTFDSKGNYLGKETIAVKDFFLFEESGEKLPTTTAIYVDNE